MHSTRDARLCCCCCARLFRSVVSKRGGMAALCTAGRGYSAVQHQRLLAVHLGHQVPRAGLYLVPCLGVHILFHLHRYPASAFAAVSLKRLVLRACLRAGGCSSLELLPLFDSRTLRHASLRWALSRKPPHCMDHTNNRQAQRGANRDAGNECKHTNATSLMQPSMRTILKKYKRSSH